MGSIFSVVSMIHSALDVVAKFQGGPELALVSGHVQDAVGVVNALTPLVTQYAAGKEITPEDVRTALAGKNSALAEFDRMIAEKSK